MCIFKYPLCRNGIYTIFKLAFRPKVESPQQKHMALLWKQTYCQEAKSPPNYPDVMSVHSILCVPIWLIYSWFLFQWSYENPFWHCLNILNFRHFFLLVTMLLTQKIKVSPKPCGTALININIVTQLIRSPTWRVVLLKCTSKIVMGLRTIHNLTGHESVNTTKIRDNFHPFRHMTGVQFLHIVCRIDKAARTLLRTPTGVQTDILTCL